MTLGGVAGTGFGLVLAWAGVALAGEPFGLSLVLVVLGLGMSGGGGVLTYIGISSCG
jgi:hypothetical protein